MNGVFARYVYNLVVNLDFGDTQNWLLNLDFDYRKKTIRVIIFNKIKKGAILY